MGCRNHLYHLTPDSKSSVMKRKNAPILVSEVFIGYRLPDAGSARLVRGVCHHPVEVEGDSSEEGAVRNECA